jgi:tetratricopeptide (TPR) repeat protein
MRKRSRILTAAVLCFFAGTLSCFSDETPNEGANPPAVKAEAAGTGETFPGVEYYERDREYTVFAANLNGEYPDVEVVFMNVDNNQADPVGCQVKISRNPNMAARSENAPRMNDSFFILLQKPVDPAKIRTEKYHNGAVISIPKKAVMDEEYIAHYNKFKAVSQNVDAVTKDIVLLPAGIDKYKEVEKFLTANRFVDGANKLAQEEDYGNAIAKYEKAIGYDPANPIAYHNMAICYYKTGDAAKAAMFAEKAVSIDPYEEKWQTFLGDLYYKAKEYKKALAKYEEVLSVAPNMPEEKLNKLYRKLFQLCVILEDPRGALLYGEKMPDRTPKEVDLMNSFVGLIKNERERIK